MDDFTNEDYWKGIILYGLNAATYKMADYIQVRVIQKDNVVQLRK